MIHFSYHMNHASNLARVKLRWLREDPYASFMYSLVKVMSNPALSQLLFCMGRRHNETSVNVVSKGDNATLRNYIFIWIWIIYK